MDIPSLVNSITPFLLPLVPYLLKAGEKATEEVGKKLGEGVWDKARTLWDKLHPKLKDKPGAIEAIRDVAQSPNDEDAVAAFRQQLKKLLTEDVSLAKEISELVGKGLPSVQAIAYGDKSIAVGGNISGSTLITGDNNTVGSKNI